MTKDEIKEWLDKHNVSNYTINDDLTVDVNGNVYLWFSQLSSIPFQFGEVTGSFNCNYNKVKSLKRAPTSVGGNFGCFSNNIKSLKYLPKTIKGNLYCDDHLKDTPEYKRYLFLKTLDE